MSRRLPAIVLGIAIVALLLLPLAALSRAQEKDKDSAGIVFNAKAGSKDVGLPIYPGSRLHKDKDNDSPSANMGLWGKGSGFKLAVVKMESDDAPDKIAAFYKKALAKYGKVLDCSNAPSASASEKSDKDDSSAELTCDDDKPEKGDLVFKSGTKNKQHIAAIQANGKGSVYQLVAMESWSDGK
jgi:hypothetical protein